MRAWVDVATLAHTKNLNGGLVAYAASGLPLLLAENMEVALVPPVLDAPRRVRVNSVTPRSEREALVFFDEVDDAATAEALVGCHCLVRRAEADLSLAAQAAVEPSWEGWRVVDARAGEVGDAVELIDRPHQPLLEVSRPDGTAVLIPLVDEFVLDVDEDARVLHLSCPDGLLDL